MDDCQIVGYKLILPITMDYLGYVRIVLLVREDIEVEAAQGVHGQGNIHNMGESGKHKEEFNNCRRGLQGTTITGTGQQKF